MAIRLNFRQFTRVCVPKKKEARVRQNELAGKFSMKIEIGMTRWVSGWTAVLGLSFSLAVSATAQPPQYLGVAEGLVLDLVQEEIATPPPAVWPNVYGSPAFINWNGTKSTARTECSTFVTQLWEHTYNWAPSHFTSWMGTNNPIAAVYHDTILNQKGFQRVPLISQIQPGDVIAIVYYPELQSPSGHVMIVQDFPATNSSKPFIAGTSQWTVPVIDSSASYHGTNDTRYAHPGGIGHGTFRLYANTDGTIAGYTWSLLGTSVADYVPQATSTSSGRHLVIGRVPGL